MERFAAEDGDAEFLAIVEQRSNHLVLVARDAQTGVLADSVRYRLSVNTPTSVLVV